VLYCFHWPLMEMLQFFDLLPQTLPVMLHSVLLAFVLLVFCTIIYLYAEVPLRRRLRRLLNTPQVKS
jgi:peptidoglycan/LPS O-acetylase OafA/YrhL